MDIESHRVSDSMTGIMGEMPIWSQNKPAWLQAQILNPSVSCFLRLNNTFRASSIFGSY